jgi:hypothetical protein
MRTTWLLLGCWSLAAASSVAADELPPGSCPAAGVEGLDLALERADQADDAAAHLDVAACYRALAQDVPESAALGRALDAGLPADQAIIVQARLDAVGWPPPPRDQQGLAATVVPSWSEETDETPVDDAPDLEAVWAYTLAGVAAAGLVGATAAGFVALDAESAGEDALTPGIAAAACGGLALAAGITALVLWPDGEVVPTAGPGEVGVGLVVVF